jgi:ubiquinone/menaquinone biosynthesis C-methylase UbiE
MTNGSVEEVITRSREELDQPGLSARALEPLTRTLFAQAGLKSGMRVLDVCSGVGDVAFLAREIVGPDGHVSGFDSSAETVEYANDRAAFRGLSNVNFVEAGFDELPFGQEFDAIVGRIVLMYRRDPAADLRSIIRCLRPGGLVIFQELDMLQGKTVPPASVVDDTRAWLLDTFARAGIELEMGPKLYATFEDAELNPPEMRVDGFIGGPGSVAPALVANVARMLMPQAEALGTVSAGQVQIDTLEERMRADLASARGVMSAPLVIGAWTTLPS